jgi:hypothetical protein
MSHDIDNIHILRPSSISFTKKSVNTIENYSHLDLLLPKKSTK